jgi:hypothetical protein
VRAGTGSRDEQTLPSTGKILLGVSLGPGEI